MAPAPLAPKAELKFAATLCVALVPSVVSSTASVGGVPVVEIVGTSSWGATTSLVTGIWNSVTVLLSEGSA